MKTVWVGLNRQTVPVIRLALHTSLILAIAFGSSINWISAAQSGDSDPLPDVDSDVTDQIDPAIDPDPEAIDPEAIDPDLDQDPNADPDPDAPDPADPVSVTDTRFDCQYTGGQYTVMYRPESRPNEAFPWAIPQALGGGWTPERRCTEISRRLEEYRPDGLQELQTSTENGYNIVCVTTDSNPSCRIVFTVPPGQDPLATRDLVFENLTIADSGESTQGVNTFVSSGNNPVDSLVNLGLSVLGRRGGSFSSARSSAINLKPHLDAADGGTGLALTQGRPVRRGRRLQPNNFR